MPFTDQGYEASKFDDLVEDIRTSLETSLGTPISSDPNNVFGIINSIFSNALSVQENNVQALSSNLDIYSAEGLYLDKLVRWIGLYRLASQPAQGNLKVWSSSTGTLDSSSIFADSNSIQYVCPNGLTHEISKCAEATLKPLNVVEGLSYTISVGSAIFSYVATDTDTVDSVVDYFVTEITDTLAITTSNVNSSLHIVGEDEELNSLELARINFTIEEVATFNYCESVLSGEQVVVPNTINVLVTASPSITKINNPVDFVSGRDLETDEELRQRHQESVALSGNGTLDSIAATLLQLNNVTDVFIRQNNTLEDIVGGLPAKTFECVVVDGDPDVISQTIWDNQPATTETYGSIYGSARDNFGNLHTVRWSRAETLYFFVEVSYGLYDEESFPSTGEELIKEAVLSYGQSLSLDSDVIPTRFIGDIYKAVDGLEGISIRVGYSTNINDTSPSSGYLDTRIEVTSEQVPVFTKAKIEVIET